MGISACHIRERIGSPTGFLVGDSQPQISMTVLRAYTRILLGGAKFPLALRNISQHNKAASNPILKSGGTSRMV